VLWLSAWLAWLPVVVGFREGIGAFLRRGVGRFGLNNDSL
jgi:hypothetical protein